VTAVRTRNIALFVALLASIGTLSIVRADELIIDKLNHETHAATGSSPTRGMTMDEVESTWGPPSSKQAPVGDPPITRWEYPHFIVYFEFSTVLHSVHKQ